MVTEEQRIPGVMRGVSPCTGCGERHTACHDKCPKDARGEYGYYAWKAEAKKVNANRKAYMAELHQVYEEEKRRKSWGRKTF